ncbi:DeoR/GlpR family DNA-binding transcription regulator [Acidocella sp.]|uniref:DeoR/GlpR family DNA-binding transcription regulator n=1 Tax=Acidocella sp. TaxID=50710 RepID=UPI0026043566|nr:DeoR/GlpR family DNA-binding transcription regulator [Acidocella sp.]
MSEKQGNDERHNGIVELVAKQGFQTMETLARHFGVTVQTIRRDVNFLAAEGRLSRYRGGAGLSSSIENMEYERRQVVNLAAKQRIAARLARDVPDSASLFINIGTTTEQAARALLSHRNLRVVTNNINVAKILSDNPQCSIVMAGGKVRNRDGAVIGQLAVQMLEQFRADIGIIGVSGIDKDGGLFDYDLDEVMCTQAIIRNSRRVLLLADHSKFGRPAMVKIGELTQISALYTDAPPPEAIAALLSSAGATLEIAP